MYIKRFIQMLSPRTENNLCRLWTVCENIEYAQSQLDLAKTWYQLGRFVELRYQLQMEEVITYSIREELQ